MIVSTDIFMSFVFAQFWVIVDRTEEAGGQVEVRWLMVGARVTATDLVMLEGCW